MPDSADLPKLLHALYGAVAEPERFHSIAGLLAASQGAHSGFVGLLNRRTGSMQRLAWTDNFSPDVDPAHVAAGFRQCMLLNRARDRISEIVSIADVLSPTAFAGTPFYNEFCKPLGIFHIIGGAMPIGDSNEIALLGVHRERRRGCFDDHARRHLATLLPHLGQALKLRSTFSALQVERNVFAQVLAAMRMGVMVVDESGRLCFANDKAESVLREQTSLRVRNGRLYIGSSRQHELLRAAIVRATAACSDRRIGSEVLLGLGDIGKRPISLFVSPLPERIQPSALRGTYALLLINDVKSPSPSLREQLAQLYGLTPAEARLAEAIANGDSLVEFAQRAKISVNTAKTHLKRIFSKTGHRRQSQFVRDVLGNPILRICLAPSEPGHGA